MICYKCGNDIPSDSEYCPFCGIKLFVTCPKCGHVHSSQYPICNKCGTDRANYIAEQQRLQEEEKRRIEEQRKIEEQRRIAAEQLAKERAIQSKIRSDWRALTSRDTGHSITAYDCSCIKTYKYLQLSNFKRTCDKVFPSNIIVPSEVKMVCGFNTDCDDQDWFYEHEGVCIDLREIEDARQRVFSSLRSLEFQEGVEKIDIRDMNRLYPIPVGTAFMKCDSLSKLNLPNSLKRIGDKAFSECTSLPEIIIPDEVEEIGRFAFRNCTSLSKLSLPNSLKKIGRAAFSGCSSLHDITIPESVESIAEGVFSGCSPDARFISKKFCPMGNQFLINGNELLSVALNGSDTITIPNGIKIIASLAFH